ncbi:MAG: thiamine diphosphokinase [Clostridium sp.]|uniref:thiamine diphosphokinase n=1 Tax=Clostridium sp. TaxID=1506 RepID=UPI003EE57F9A
MRILIVTGGSKPSYELIKKYMDISDFIIGVDSGINTLYHYRIIPNLIVGDFDSGKKTILEHFRAKGIEVRGYSTEKDYTDTHLGYNIGREMGASEIYLLGAIGSRMDHTFGNIGLFLNSIEDNIKLIIENENNRIYLGHDNEVIRREDGKYLSFHALSNVVKDFSIKNAKYELESYDLKLFEPRAISNEFLAGEDVTINFKEGNILILITND